MTVDILLVLLFIFSFHCNLCQYLLAATRADGITEYAYELISDEKKVIIGQT